MQVMNQDKLLNQVEKLYANAKDGSLKINDESYSFTFDSYQGIYTVSDSSGNVITRFNTRKITQARKWLREYLAN